MGKPFKAAGLSPCFLTKQSRFRDHPRCVGVEPKAEGLFFSMTLAKDLLAACLLLSHFQDNRLIVFDGVIFLELSWHSASSITTSGYFIAFEVIAENRSHKNICRKLESTWVA